MNKMLFAAVALSLVLSAPAFAQTSDQATPNSLHGAGDMMQDGPHASAPPASATNLPSGMTHADKQKACQAKWDDAVANNTTADRSKHDFLHECMSAH